MSNSLAVPAQESRMSIFGNRERVMLGEVNIDIVAIIETYQYFLTQQKEDPELKIPTYRAKIPSGGGKAFDIITGDENLDTSIPSFRGVIANFCNCNSLFNAGDNMNEPPICASADGIYGIAAADGEVHDCAECQHNQWGSGTKGGRGKACKNMRRLAILADGCDMPIIMTLPPTSISEWEKYKSAVLGVQRRHASEVVTEFSLITKTNSNGVKYSVVQFKAVGFIDSNTKMSVKALAAGEIYNHGVSADDYNAAETN